MINGYYFHRDILYKGYYIARKRNNGVKLVCDRIYYNVSLLEKLRKPELCHSGVRQVSHHITSQPYPGSVSSHCDYISMCLFSPEQLTVTLYT